MTVGTGGAEEGLCADTLATERGGMEEGGGAATSRGGRGGMEVVERSVYFGREGLVEVLCVGDPLEAIEGACDATDISDNSVPLRRQRIDSGSKVEGSAF
mmetsp:Transcript_3096/g.6240  ORF Transcript_3096/g.6240 Transcript_3096/m.6240 type:complete len:100 (+) Transcript_3096:620-919(+)